MRQFYRMFEIRDAPRLESTPATPGKGFADPKIGFHETIKEIEARLGDPAVSLASFIASNTPSHEMRKQWGVDKAAMAARHILFQEEDKDTYVRNLLETIAS